MWQVVHKNQCRQADFYSSSIKPPSATCEAEGGQDVAAAFTTAMLPGHSPDQILLLEEKSWTDLAEFRYRANTSWHQ
jgi:hypothetical protein